MPEVRVEATQIETVLKHQRGNPQGVGRDGSAFLTQLEENPCVVFRSDFVRQENIHARAGQKLPQRGEVLPTPATGGKARAQFSQHDGAVNESDPLGG